MAEEYVIFWTNPRGDPSWEEFDCLEDAQKQLASWAIGYPWNRYILAKVIGHQEPTAERQVAVKITPLVREAPAVADSKTPPGCPSGA